MSAEILEAKAHELIGQLDPAKLAAVVQYLEVIVRGDDDDGEVSDKVLQRLHESRVGAANGENGTSMEEVLADFGLTLSDFPLSK